MSACRTHPVLERLHGRFARLYGAEADLLTERAAMLVGRYGLAAPASAPGPRWTERDALLITYADALHRLGEPALATLRRFLETRVDGAFTHVHLLPFYPSSSDDGFSVIHYRTVDPAAGDWPHVRALGEQFRLVFDLVLNHVSARSGWFADYLAGIAPARHYFIEGDPSADRSSVVRPRTLPLLTPVVTQGGPRHVWTTFSADQIDLNYACPDLLFEILDIILFYVAQGARVLRLDAVAYLWKQPGTPCIHLPQVHEIVKLIRDLLRLAAPDTVLLTETNVPHAENVAYFGEGDEAHWVYQFSLPPLLLHALGEGRARELARWLAALEDPPPGCTFLNFTASHDGIGLRPLEGLVPTEEVLKMADRVRPSGGVVAFARRPGGDEIPYELNCTWYDALGGPGIEPDAQEARFLCSQTVPLALKGIPAVYLNSLFASRNDTALAALTGRPRSLNRTKWNLEDLEPRLTPDRCEGRMLAEITRRLHRRAASPALHPDGGQRIRDADARVLAVERISPDRRDRLLCLANLSADQVSWKPDGFDIASGGCDRLAEPGAAGAGEIGAPLAPYECRWIPLAR